MAILGTAQMAVNIAMITVFSRFVRLLVHAQDLGQLFTSRLGGESNMILLL
jgi:hypothetical protein